MKLGYKRVRMGDGVWVGVQYGGEEGGRVEEGNVRTRCRKDKKNSIEHIENLT